MRYLFVQQKVSWLNVQLGFKALVLLSAFLTLQINELKMKTCVMFRSVSQQLYRDATFS